MLDVHRQLLTTIFQQLVTALISGCLYGTLVTTIQLPIMLIMWINCYNRCMSIDRDKSSSVIEHFYRDVFACISKVTADCIPSRQHSGSDFNVPGWNMHVNEKHDAARAAYMNWLDAGKPKFGYYFDCIKRTRAVFKLALRYCRNHLEQLKADACAERLFDKDPCKFWNSVYKRPVTLVVLVGIVEPKM